ncbi:MAG: UbiA family prenyltransferase [Pseudomonadota bacterium]
MNSKENSSLLSDLKLYGALSRTPHGLLELAIPGLAALLCLGGLPSPYVIALGLVTALAGYTSVYALNDLVDYHADRERIRQAGFMDTEIFVESGLIRHPVAQGQLSFKQGLTWCLFWAVIALVGAWLLNPVCAFIFLGGAFLEAVYCLLLRVSPIRTLVHGVVKTSGAMAAVFAVSPEPPVPFLAALFFWIFFWEIGGQNIPADWHDIEEDKVLHARTVPLLFGPRKAGFWVSSALATSVILSLIVLWSAPGRPSLFYFGLILVLGLYLLIWPAFRLLGDPSRTRTGALFSRATYYPPAVFLVLGFDIISRFGG